MRQLPGVSSQENMYEGQYSRRSTGAVTCLETGTGDLLTSMGFQVLNFVDFVILEPKPETPFGFSPRVIDLRCSDWRIRVTAVEGSTAVFKLLNETGGYAFTHLGHLERVDGSTFAAEDTEGVVDALIQLLSFARGEACSLPVRWGIDGDGAVTWQGWYSPVVDTWRGNAQTWFDEHHGNLLAELFPSIAAKLFDRHLSMPVKIALHWYRKCNSCEGGMEGAIVLGLMVLDLLGALIVVDDKSLMSESEYDDLRAASKLAALLQALSPCIDPGATLQPGGSCERTGMGRRNRHANRTPARLRAFEPKAAPDRPERTAPRNLRGMETNSLVSGTRRTASLGSPRGSTGTA